MSGFMQHPGSQADRNAIAFREVLSLLQKAERVGSDASDIVTRARIPWAAADILGEFPPPLERRQLVALYRECIVAIGSHSSRIDGKPQMHPDEFRLMCHCVITCRSLEAVIERQAMFFRTRGERLSRISMAEDGQRVIVEVDTLRRRRSLAAFLSDLAGMSMFSRLYAWLLGLGDHHFSIGLAHSGRYAHEGVTELFAGDLRFDQPVNSIGFPRRLLAMPIVRTSTELEALLDEFPFDFPAARPAAIPLSDRIRSLYTLRIARGDGLPSLLELAAQLGHSPSTLRRHLALEGNSIMALKDSARHEAALDFLARGRRKIDDVAFQLGFRDVDGFRSAFRRWTGGTPGEIRNRVR